MGQTTRHYLFPEEGDPLRLPQRLIDGLVHGKDAILEYAGSRLRVLSVYLSTDGGRPQEIVEIGASVWVFDEEGKIQRGLQEAAALAMGSFRFPTSQNDTVVPLRSRLNEKKLKDEYRWTPSKADIDRVAADIWPRGKTTRLKSAKGIALKRHPLTWDAKQALANASETFFTIDRAIRDLKEPSLKGLIFKARQEAEDDPDFGPLYRAVAELAEEKLEIKRRHKSGKGIWYACLDVVSLEGPHGFPEVTATYSEECEGRRAAVAAARKLLAEHVDKLTEHTSVDARVITDLEWRG